MFLISNVNKLCKTTKIFNGFSKGYVSRSLFRSSCYAQNKEELRNVKLNKENKPPNVQSDSKDGDFIKIYRNKVIFIGGIINKLKWYQTLITVCTVPVSMGLLMSGTIPESTAINIVFTSAWLTAILYAHGFIFHRTIGLIYLSKDNKTVKIAYLGFWGEKEEEEYPIEQVVPFNELPTTFTSRIFITADFDMEKYRLYLSPSGDILDEDRFATVFGAVK